MQNDNITSNQEPLSFREGGNLSSPLTRLLDGFVNLMGYISHFGWISLVLVILASVTMRYVLGDSRVWLEELQWHIFGACFMIGLSYALVADEHVRVDILADGWKAKTQAKIEIADMVMLVLPFALVIAYDSISFVQFSHRTNEISGSPGGLPYRFIIKSFLPFSLILLSMAALARALKMLQLLKLIKAQEKTSS